MTQSIAFHSYKGGTGKTTIACNLAAMLATKGYNVFMLELDVYAPSLHAYFEKTPEKWINDLLSDRATVDEVMVDMTPVVEQYAPRSKKTGKLLIGFSNPQKEEVYKLESGGKEPKIQLLRKFIQLREELISEHGSDYIIIDTRPGIRFWSINSLAIADTLFLTQDGRSRYRRYKKDGRRYLWLVYKVWGKIIPVTEQGRRLLHP